MSIQLELPNIGEGVEEADIAEVLVSVGDVIEANQTVMELETEKAVVELPCPHAGTIEEILVSSGDTVRVGDPILVISSNGDGSARASKKDSSEKPASSVEQSAEKPESSSDQDKKPQPAEEPAEPETEMVTGEIEFRLPPLGEGVSSADVAEVSVSEGDIIEANQTVMELETEKAVVELPCPHAGKVKKIHVSEGDSISVDDVVLTIESSKTVSTPQKEPKKSDDKHQAPPPHTTAEKQETRTKQPETPQKPPEPERRLATTSGAGEMLSPKTPDHPTGETVPAAPSTRRLARQLGVDLRHVKGSATGGRITQDDVQAYVRKQLSLPIRAEGPSVLAPSAGSLAPPPLPDFTRFGPVEREKMNKIARTSAENLIVSWNVIPHVTHHERVDITDLEAARKRFSQGIGKNGPKITMTAIVIKALATCLQAFPKFNSSLDPETAELVYKRYYHIGCAVDTPNGLLVPVVRDCNHKNILDIAAELGDLAAKARDRKLPIDAMQGATCTVTNLGGIGGVAFSPIINYPEVCILGMSRGQQELKLIEGQVTERLILTLSLSYDHRVINGADAARFMVMLANLLGDPFQMLTTV